MNFYSPWNHQKTCGFLMISWGTEVNQFVWIRLISEKKSGNEQFKFEHVQQINELLLLTLYIDLHSHNRIQAPTKHQTFHYKNITKIHKILSFTQKYSKIRNLEKYWKYSQNLNRLSSNFASKFKQTDKLLFHLKSWENLMILGGIEVN